MTNKRNKMYGGLIDKKLSNFSRLPRYKDILGRYHFLQKESKGSSTSLIVSNMIYEINTLWTKMSIPVMSNSNIKRNILNFIKKYKTISKGHSNKSKMNKFNDSLNNIFDATPPCPKFLCYEDKEFYNLQKTSGGSIGYISKLMKDMKLNIFCQLNNTYEEYDALEDDFKLNEKVDSKIFVSVNLTSYIAESVLGLVNIKCAKRGAIQKGLSDINTTN
ncbi:hypothetical protein A3Q56_02294 [Intoshia linei]|uniref:Uncharacterized protein n=1 Tax=Intoshia linei TaxID=1819745 RepID=A0A177B8R3_9BILA|nr:hypothetical protein A3Q56_02294 [Intoshia linei]